jgi:hypothetical protein
MAANILNSERAVDASVQVVRAFVKLRQLLASSAELTRKVEALERKYDANFKEVFDSIKKLMMPPVSPKVRSVLWNQRKRNKYSTAAADCPRQLFVPGTPRT